MDPWSGDKTAEETKDVIKAQIDAGWPIPHLVLHHNNPNFKFYDWHWFLLTGYTEFDGDFMVKAVTYGSWRWLDFDGLWNTGSPQKRRPHPLSSSFLRIGPALPVPFTEKLSGCIAKRCNRRVFYFMKFAVLSHWRTASDVSPISS